VLPLHLLMVVVVMVLLLPLPLLLPLMLLVLVLLLSLLLLHQPMQEARAAEQQAAPSPSWLHWATACCLLGGGAGGRGLAHHDVAAPAVAANVLQPLDVLGHDTALQGSSSSSRAGGGGACQTLIRGLPQQLGYRS
jgi:hypothetical protein